MTAGFVVGSTFYGFVAFAGEKHVKNWMRKFYRIVDLPTGLLSAAIFTMLLGSLVHIGGFYGDTLYRLVLCSFILGGVAYLIISVCLVLDQWQFLEQEKLHPQSE